jgi:hypothetical protein
MAHRTLFAVLLLTLCTTASAQTKWATYAEFGGSGLLPTANIERRFTPHFAGRIGLSVILFTEDDDGDNITALMPIVGSYISHPTGNHHFEAGGGVLIGFGDTDDFDSRDGESNKNIAITGLLGYRYQKPERGFMFRAGFTPIHYDEDITPIAGVSFGYNW